MRICVFSRQAQCGRPGFQTCNHIAWLAIVKYQYLSLDFPRYGELVRGDSEVDFPPHNPLLLAPCFRFREWKPKQGKAVVSKSWTQESRLNARRRSTELKTCYRRHHTSYLPRLLRGVNYRLHSFRSVSLWSYRLHDEFRHKGGVGGSCLAPSATLVSVVVMRTAYVQLGAVGCMIFGMKIIFQL